MRFIPTVIFASAIVLAAANALPIAQEEARQSATLDALRDWFSPVTNYFTETFPEQTPSDIADNIRETISDAHKWTQENEYIQTAVDAVNPYWQSVQDTANNLSQQTFSDIYGDISQGVQNLDQQIGGYINEWNKGTQ